MEELDRNNGRRPMKNQNKLKEIVAMTRSPSTITFVFGRVERVRKYIKVYVIKEGRAIVWALG